MIERLFHISRQVLRINTIGPAVVGIRLAGDLWRWEALPLLAWLTLPFNPLIYGVNDIFDQETDAKNPRKGTLEGARIWPKEVPITWYVVLLTNTPFLLYFLFFLPLDVFFWMLLYAALFVGYSAPTARFKARPYLDSLSNVAYSRSTSGNILSCILGTSASGVRQEEHSTPGRWDPGGPWERDDLDGQAAPVSQQAVIGQRDARRS